MLMLGNIGVSPTPAVQGWGGESVLPTAYGRRKSFLPQVHVVLKILVAAVVVFIAPLEALSWCGDYLSISATNWAVSE